MRLKSHARFCSGGGTGDCLADHIEYCACHKPISPLRNKPLASKKKKMDWAKESRLDTLVKPSIFPVEAFLSDLEG